MYCTHLYYKAHQTHTHTRACFSNTKREKRVNSEKIGDEDNDYLVYFDAIHVNDYLFFILAQANKNWLVTLLFSCLFLRGHVGPHPNIYIRLCSAFALSLVFVVELTHIFGISILIIHLARYFCSYFLESLRHFSIHFAFSNINSHKKFKMW